MGTSRLFVCTITLPFKNIFGDFGGSNFIAFAKDWPIQAILVISDDHKGYGVQSLDFFFFYFSLGGDKGGKETCFVIFWLIPSTDLKKQDPYNFICSKNHQDHYD